MSDGTVRCAVCRKVCKGRVPKGGDGSGLVPYPHKRWKTGRNPYTVGGGGGLVDCEGRLEIGELVSDGGEDRP